ncbi:MAG TPA: M48 family metallopeptidase [Chthonomonadales bacterium]|nr:M48 family metallopeptidase [Chthonomonadales bacterium]
MRSRVAVWIAFVSAAALVSCAVAAEGQTVGQHSLNEYVLFLRYFQNAASKQGCKDWPAQPRKPGTRVMITFDPQNADITLVTPFAYGVPHLLDDCRRIAERIGRPRADYYTVQGTYTVSVDIELNKDLRRSRFRTDFDLDLSALAAALSQASLPHPIVVAIDTRMVDPEWITPGGKTISIQNVRFIHAGDVTPGSALRFHAVLSWAAIPGIALFAVIGVILLVGPWVVGRSLLKTPVEPAAPDPDQIQKKCDKGLSHVKWAILTLVAPGLLLATLDRRQVELPFGFLMLPNLMMMLASYFLIVSLGVLWLRAKRVRRVRPSSPKLASILAGPLGFAFPFLVTLPVLFAINLIPLYSGQALIWRKWIVFALIGVTLVSSAVLGWRRSRKARTELIDGPWHAALTGLAQRAGVPAPRLYQLDSPLINAFVTRSGAVLITTGLTEKLSPQEVEAIMAHELAHIHCGHHLKSRRAAWIALACMGVLFCIGLYINTHVQPEALVRRLLFFTPMPLAVIFQLVIGAAAGKGRRLRELEADRMSLQWIDNPEIMVSALNKLHYLSGQPARLKLDDQLVSSHPALAHRVEAIRAETELRPHPQEEEA